MAKPDQSNSAATDLLIADLEHFGESMWRNEEVGEKRFNFFVTFVTAVIGGLVALHTSQRKPDEATLTSITSGALVGLLVFGILTYLRMLHRNRVTDQYQRTLKYIRERLLALNPSLTEYKVPQPLHAGKWKWLRGGLAETVGAMDAVLLGALLRTSNVLDAGWVVAISFFSLLVFWGLAAPRKGVS